MRRINEIEKSQLYFGDNKEVLDSLPAYCCHLLIADPPYRFTKGVHSETQKAKSNMCKSALYDYTDNSGMCRVKNGLQRKDIYAWIDKVPRIMVKMNAYVFCSEEQIADYYEWAREHKYKVSVLVWEKPVCIISKQRYAQNVEFIVRIYENGTALNKLEDSSMYSRVIKSSYLKAKYHPTQKPLEIFDRIITLSSKKDNVVIDPFLGSGTTAISAAKLGRKYIGIENNEKFFKIAEERIKKEAGKSLNIFVNQT